MNISHVLTKLKSLIYSKSETDSLLGGKANSSHTHTKSQITDFPAYGNTAGTICQGNDARLSDARTPTSHTHTKSQITDFPTIPSKTSQLTNDSGFITGISWANVSGKPSTFTPSSHTHTKSQITDFPTIPSKTSQLTNDSGFLNYSVKNKTGIGSLGYVNDATDNVLITSNTLAYWDGAYSGTTSNLTYCKKGAFGDIVTHNASEFLSVTRGSSISTGGSGYWAAMCNSSETGSPTLPTTNQWWHVLSMDWSGNSNNVTDWCSQLALPTQQNSCLYWRRNNSGGTSINNSTWHKVIDDTNIGSQSVNYANSAGSAGSASSATYAGYVQGDKSTGLYVNSVKYGNALVTTNQSNFGAIWNAPTKNYRVACTTYPNANDDVYLCYSVTNANVNSSTNTVSRECVWNANDGTLRTANVKATEGLYYNSYRIYVG